MKKNLPIFTFIILLVSFSLSCAQEASSLNNEETNNINYPVTHSEYARQFIEYQEQYYKNYGKKIVSKETDSKSVSEANHDNNTLKNNKDVLSNASDIIQPEAEIYTLEPEFVFHILHSCPEEIIDIIRPYKKRHTVDKRALTKKLILYGPPGTGKSTLAKAIADECDMVCFCYKAGTIANEFKNSGAQNIERIFKNAIALKQPCVVVIDELDVIFKMHKSKNNNEPGMLETLWSSLDVCTTKYPVFFIGTYNDISTTITQMEDRFSGDIIEIPLPDVELREKLIKYYLDSYNTTQFDKSVVPNLLAKETKDFSHRKIERMFPQAIRIALKRNENECIVTFSDFVAAINKVKKNKAAIDEKAKILKRKKFAKKILQWSPSFLSFIGAGLTIGGMWLSNEYQKYNVHFQKQSFEQQQKIASQQLDVQNQSLATQKRIHNINERRTQFFGKEYV